MRDGRGRGFSVKGCVQGYVQRYILKDTYSYE